MANYEVEDGEEEERPPLLLVNVWDRVAQPTTNLADAGWGDPEEIANDDKSTALDQTSPKEPGIQSLVSFPSSSSSRENPQITLTMNTQLGAWLDSQNEPDLPTPSFGWGDEEQEPSQAAITVHNHMQSPPASRSFAQEVPALPPANMDWEVAPQSVVPSADHGWGDNDDRTPVLDTANTDLAGGWDQDADQQPANGFGQVQQYIQPTQPSIQRPTNFEPRRMVVKTSNPANLSVAETWAAVIAKLVDLGRSYAEVTRRQGELDNLERLKLRKINEGSDLASIEPTIRDIIRRVDAQQQKAAKMTEELAAVFVAATSDAEVELVPSDLARRLSAIEETLGMSSAATEPVVSKDPRLRGQASGAVPPIIKIKMEEMNSFKSEIQKSVASLHNRFNKMEPTVAQVASAMTINRAFIDDFTRLVEPCIPALQQMQLPQNDGSRTQYGGSTPYSSGHRGQATIRGGRAGGTTPRGGHHGGSPRSPHSNAGGDQSGANTPAWSGQDAPITYGESEDGGWSLPAGMSEQPVSLPARQVSMPPPTLPASKVANNNPQNSTASSSKPLQRSTTNGPVDDIKANVPKNFRDYVNYKVGEYHKYTDTRFDSRKAFETRTKATQEKMQIEQAQTNEWRKTMDDRLSDNEQQISELRSIMPSAFSDVAPPPPPDDADGAPPRKRLRLELDDTQAVEQNIRADLDRVKEQVAALHHLPQKVDALASKFSECNDQIIQYQKSWDDKGPIISQMADRVLAMSAPANAALVNNSDMEE